ncbi:hypothetical protein [Microbacterium sp. SA39]|uniref:hypothetical protein n=1 Tax=Microbacterium sp. SA39 TaxID=1263625 RepID=UPI00061FA66B|nr:hypothetical protein [Microbacterium sp. SA39]KJQ55077.1 hypothetical protein RS85_01136 [Microbacterium sp. SA39]
MTLVSSWVAICFGALDVRSHELAAGTFEIIVTPTTPGEPLMLHGEGARLWQSIIAAPMADENLSGDERGIIADMELMGIASSEVDHHSRVDHLAAPWLTAPLHELVYALLARVAEEIGTRILFIKGPTLHAQGLRDRVHSGDVDCWVEPGAETRFARAMQQWGWAPAFSAFTGTRVLHSLTLRASEWGCAVDVHSWFPGITLSPAEAFESAYTATELREFAGLKVRTPTRDVHSVISALNEVRPLRGELPSRSKVEAAAKILKNGGESSIEVAERFGAEYALADALALAFPDRAFDFSNARVPLDWRWRLQRHPLRVYWAALSIVPLRRRPRTIFRILWPTAESLRSGPVSERGRTIGLRALRLHRLRVGLKQIRSKVIR